MPLRIVEPNLENVKPELHGLYVKDATSGHYHLELSDLKTYVETHVSPVENELKLARENERRLALSAALRNANVLQDVDDLLVQRFEHRIALDSENGQRVISILAEDGTFLTGKDSSGRATIDDLVKEITAKFPSMFNGGGTPLTDIEDPSRTPSKSDFKSEKERAAWVEKHGLAAYQALPTVAAKQSIARKSDFRTEKDRAAFVNTKGLSAYNALPD
ncbi:hypothetical protein ABIG06_006843 [Bradyrhizobium sp. USDA 326]|uniref:hypothetical protein n=1 Tax=Bradyrhizobium sp. USDA 326 TaxID=3377726 RepID=UPI003C786F11